MAAKPTRRQVAAAMASQAPPDWTPNPRTKTRRKLTDDGLENLGGSDDRDRDDPT